MLSQGTGQLLYQVLPATVPHMPQVPSDVLLLLCLAFSCLPSIQPLPAAWMAAVWEFVVIICLFAPIRSLESYAEKRMVAVWRTHLTQVFITAYTTNKAYFHMQVRPQGCSRAEQHS